MAVVVVVGVSSRLDQGQCNRLFGLWQMSVCLSVDGGGVGGVN